MKLVGNVFRAIESIRQVFVRGPLHGKSVTGAWASEFASVTIPTSGGDWRVFHVCTGVQNGHIRWEFSGILSPRGIQYAARKNVYAIRQIPIASKGMIRTLRKAICGNALKVVVIRGCPHVVLQQAPKGHNG